MRRTTEWLTVLIILTWLGGCQQQSEQQRIPADDISGVPERIWINPGSGSALAPQVQNPHAENIEAMQDGKRLFGWYNCNTCHGPYGGGGIGPSLRDTVWIYGGNPVGIYKSIVEGRPDGMPTWQGKIPENEVWKIVTYVQSLSRPGGSPVSEVPEPARPGR